MNQVEQESTLISTVTATDRHNLIEPDTNRTEYFSSSFLFFFFFGFQFLKKTSEKKKTQFIRDCTKYPNRIR